MSTPTPIWLLAWVLIVPLGESLVIISFRRIDQVIKAKKGRACNA